MSGRTIGPEPFRVEPVFSPRLWGSRSLAPLFPEKSNLDEPLGEAWLTGVDCAVACGPHAGKTLGEAWSAMPPEWRGTRLASCDRVPMLVKFIFPQDKLSIQVHPDDAYAAAHEQAAGGRGKTEMWHAVSCDPGASLLLGLKAGIDKQKFLDAMKGNRLEEVFQSHAVNAGDTFFIAAGTPHTIGPRMILCEVQEYSDLTYRVYDYGRVDGKGKPRELHIEKALEVMKFGAPAPAKVPPLPLQADRVHKVLLAACPYFAAERWEFRSTVQTESLQGSFEVLVILEGAGHLHGHGPARAYRRGQCWFIPASLGEFSLQPEQSSTLMRAYVPDLMRLRAELRRGEVSDSQLAQTVFA